MSDDLQQQVDTLKQQNQQLTEQVHCYKSTIDALKQVESSQERYRFFAKASFEAIVIHDKGVLLHANDRFFELFQYQRDELEDQMMSSLLTSASLEIATMRIANGLTESYEIECIKKDGSLFAAEIFPREDVFNGRPVRATAMRDITE
ncbi:MAG: PAS domain S-box-containing protein [Phenylobacterium sp.]|jgi:PAS domain S-box-containing protein